MKYRLFIGAAFFFFLVQKGFGACGDSVVVEICSTSGMSGTFETKRTSVFDSLGHLLSLTGFTFNGTNWVTSYRQSNAYDISGNLILHTNETGNGLNGWDLNQRYTYTYNTNNQVLTFLAENNYGILSSRTYTYDNQFHLIESDEYRWYTNNPINYKRTLYYPDANGNDSLVVNETGDSLGWNNDSKNFKFYNSDNLVVHDSMLQWNPGPQTWYLYRDQYRSYDSTSMDSTIVFVYDSTGALTTQQYNLFIYDTLNNARVVAYYYWDGIQWQHDPYSDDSTYYDQWGNVIRSVSPSGIFNAVYDSLGNILHEDQQFWGLSGGFTDYSYSSGVLVYTYSFSSTQGGFTSTTGCSFHYADIEGPAFTCGNTSVTLNAMPCGTGYQYLWSTGATTASITVNTPGTYTVTVTFPGGFSSLSPDFHVYASSSASVSLGPDTLYCTLNTYTLNAGYGYASYLWQDSSFLQSIVISDSVPGTLTCWVQVADTMGCIASDTVEIAFQVCAGMNDALLYLSSILVYPNPARDEFYISCSDCSTNEKVSIEIFNTLGEKIYSAGFHNAQTVNCERFPKGIYFVRVSNGRSQQTQKVVIY